MATASTVGLFNGGSTTNNNVNWKKGLRRGKWTAEEEAYTERLIHDFSEGLLNDIENGTTLRSWLAQKLDCCPMRISKKFVGESSIGKRMFERNEIKLANMSKDEIRLRENELNRLYIEFKDSWERDLAEKQDSERSGKKKKRKRGKKLTTLDKKMTSSKVVNMAKQTKPSTKKRFLQEKENGSKRSKLSGVVKSTTALTTSPSSAPITTTSLVNHNLTSSESADSTFALLLPTNPVDTEAFSFPNSYLPIPLSPPPLHPDLAMADTQWLMEALPGLESCYDVLQDANSFDIGLSFGKPKDGGLSGIPSLDEVISSPSSVLDVFSDAYTFLFKPPTDVANSFE